jgi:hypothetical protein
MSAEIDAFATSPAFEAADSPYLIVDRKLRICAVNPAYETATAYPRTVLLGEQLFDVFPDNPRLPDADGVANLSASLETVFRTGGRDRMSLQRYDVRDRHAPERFVRKLWRPVNSPISDERGRTVAVLHHVEDVTDFFPPISEDLRRQVDTLREALDTNRHISVAIGLVMAATGADRGAAFQLLLKQSQNSNRKLREIAVELVAQHEQRFTKSVPPRPQPG